MTTVYDLISNGGAFQNPVTPAIVETRNILNGYYTGTGLILDIKNDLLGIGPNPVEHIWDASQVEELESLLGDIDGVLNEVQEVTDQLAGVGQLSANAEANLRTALNISASLNAARGSISCGPLNEVFGIITEGVNLMTDVGNAIATILLDPPAQVLSLIATAYNFVVTTIASSISAFESMVKEAMDRALAGQIESLYQDACAKEILDIVTTPEMRNLLS